MASKPVGIEIVSVGSCMIDFVSYAKQCPKPGETVMGRKFTTNFGGKGANQCMAAAKLGGSTAMVARLGTDIWANRYIENFIKTGVDVKYVRKTEEEESGIAQITVAEGGQNQIIIVPGANSKLSEKDVDDAAEYIKNAKVVLLQLETPIKTALRTLHYCKGISILNGAPASKEVDKQILSLPSIFVVNETEAETFSGLPVKNVKEAGVAAKKLLDLGCKSVIITLGADGAIYKSKASGDIKRFTCPEVEVVDTTGAGDVFIGALALLLSRDNPIEKSIEVACEIATESTMKPGTQPSFPESTILKKFNVK